jgi:hypothetical protein
MASPAVEDSIADARGQCGQLAWPIATGAEQLDLALEVSLICLEKVIYMEKEASSLRRYNAEGRLLLDPGDLDGPPRSQCTNRIERNFSNIVRQAVRNCQRAARRAQLDRTLDGGDP